MRHGKICVPNNDTDCVRKKRNEKYRGADGIGGLVGFCWVHDTVETMYTSSQNHKTMRMDAKETMCTSSLQAAAVVV